MKLNELAVHQPTKQVSKIFESFFDQRVNFDHLNRGTARKMLVKVKALVQEHRASRDFHQSEKNPAYLKLMMMEQALTAQLHQQNLYHQVQLQESEVQQAQVVLAAQDMVDQVQGMLEDITELQFKELPALVDSIRNQIGMDQANQFNTDATAALGGLVQNLQTAKASLESSLSVVTGQQTASVLPTTGDAEIDVDPLGADGDTLGADLDDLDTPAADLDIDIEEPVQGPELGRKRR
jgi:paraquat-inducible protein B